MKSLGERIKTYEAAYDISLPIRAPVIIRVDGKRFSKFTKKAGLQKPFDISFSNAMTYTCLETAKQMEGCVFGYAQSDEITYILRNDQSEESEPWFGNRLQKMLSVSASMTSVHFSSQMSGRPCAYFDARIFIVPDIQEAVNVLIWRQNDCIKNSISAACYYESAKFIGKKTARSKMEGLNQKQQQEMLYQETKINWNNYAPRFKQGVACYKIKDNDGHSNWHIDENLPNFANNQEFVKNKILNI